MYNIGICYYEKDICWEIEKLILEYSSIKNICLNTQIWYSGENLCSYLNDNSLDLLFLGIKLKKMNGIEVGNYIRNNLNDYITTIIFVSSISNIPISLFKVHPFDLLVLPITPNQINELLDKTIYIFEKKNLYFEFKNKNVLNRVLYENIYYLYSNNRKIILVTQKGDYEFYGKLTAIASCLPQDFIMVHRSYIININYIIEYKYKLIKIINGDLITISQTYQKVIKDKLK